MAAITETIVITTATDAGGTLPRQGAQQLALLTPRETGQAVGANTVKKYRRIVDAETDFTVGSKLAKGVRVALLSGAPFVFAMTVAPRSGADGSDQFTETITGAGGTATGTLMAARKPFTSIDSATVDGAAKTVKYTHLDPTGQSVAAGDVLFNTKTGAFKSGTALTGAGAGFVIIYKSHDWSAAFAKLDLEAYEYHTISGHPYNAQYFGIYDNLVAHAGTENKLIAAGLDDAVVAVDIETFVEATRSGRLYVLAGKVASGEDLTSGIASTLASSPVGGTMKEQIAPRGVSFDDTYTRTDFGDEETPISGSFHEMGANAVFRDRGGQYRISNDRASTALSNFERFHGTRRVIRKIEVDLEDAVVDARQRSPTGLPLTDAGLGVLRNVLEAELGQHLQQGLVDSFSIVIPRKADIPAADVTKRIVSGVEVNIVLAGQIHLVKLALNVRL